MSDGQRYYVVEDRGWVPDTVYGARLIVVAPVGGTGMSPRPNDVLIRSGEKHNARSDLGVPLSGYRVPDTAPTEPPNHPGYDSNHPGGPRAP